MRIRGRKVVERHPVTGGYTHADRSVVVFDGGQRAFAKAATDDLTAAWLRAEHVVYQALAGAPFLVEVLAWEDDGGHPVLVLEDPSACHWPPPWRAGDVDAVLDMMSVVAATPPPAQLGDAVAAWRSVLRQWPAVASDPAPLLELGVCTASWLDRALPVLEAASARADLSGPHLVHWDLRSDNLCFRADGTPVLVDWNWAAVGSARADVAFWLPSLHAEGGPPPETVIGDACAEEAALVAGFFARNAGLPVIPHAPRVRQVQRVQLATALPWAARVHGLPPPI